MTAARKKPAKKKRAASKKRWGPPAQREKPVTRSEGEGPTPVALHPPDLEGALKRLLGIRDKRDR